MVTCPACIEGYGVDVTSLLGTAEIKKYICTECAEVWEIREKTDDEELEEVPTRLAAEDQFEAGEPATSPSQGELLLRARAVGVDGVRSRYTTVPVRGLAIGSVFQGNHCLADASRRPSKFSVVLNISQADVPDDSIIEDLFSYIGRDLAVQVNGVQINAVVSAIRVSAAQGYSAIT